MSSVSHSPIDMYSLQTSGLLMITIGPSRNSDYVNHNDFYA